MIYLIESAGYEVRENNSISYFKLLKIGYTEDNNKDKRFLQYKLHNPTCQILFEIPGATEDHEKRVQYKFKNLLFEDYGREWFKYSEEIIDFFKNIKSLEDIENNLPKGNSDKNKYLKYKNKVKNILRYVSDIPCRSKEFNILCEEIFDILGDKVVDEKYTMNYLENRFGKESIEKYNKIINSRKSGIYCEDDIVNQEAYKFLDKYNSLTEARKKLIMLCECSLSGDLSSEAINIILSQIPDSDYIKSYYKSLGPQRLKALGYIRANIEKELGIVTFSWELLMDSIYSEFKENEKYSLSSLKIKLGSLYKSINYTKTPKASDIENWFEIKKIKLYEKYLDGTRKQSKGYELLKSKEQELRQELKLAQ